MMAARTAIATRVSTTRRGWRRSSSFGRVAFASSIAVTSVVAHTRQCGAHASSLLLEKRHWSTVKTRTTR